jgi:hypothetical protein
MNAYFEDLGENPRGRWKLAASSGTVATVHRVDYRDRRFKDSTTTTSVSGFCSNNRQPSVVTDGPAVRRARFGDAARGTG